MESQEKNMYRKGETKQFLSILQLFFLLVDTWFDFPSMKISCLFLLDSKPIWDVATVAWAVC